MSIRRLAILSMHTSPLAQPGAGDGGGMNVYVRALASALARAGVDCDVLTRADHAEQPAVLEVEDGFRVLHVEAGPKRPVPKHELPALVEPFVEATLALVDGGESYDVLHANYWLSGAVGHRLKHELELPLAATFHTLDRVKADAGVGDDPAERARVEAEVIGCTDLMLAATVEERSQLVELYGGDPERVEIVPPGVDHEMFGPGDKGEARHRLGIERDARVLLFVGRIQPLKGADLALHCLAELCDPRAVLVVVGGPSGIDGEAELRRIRSHVDELDLAGRVRLVPPQPHGALTDYYRAADVCLVPSRAESFGLVALEAAACGTPVVASDVGGLRTLVDDGVTGFRIEGRAPAEFAAPVARLLADPELARMMGARAEAESRRYAWSMTAARLRRLYADLAAHEPVRCR
ncbi:MAG: glycosyltransferase [Acidimicrobiia bacterium]